MRILFCLASKPNKNSMNVCIRNLAAIQDGLLARGHQVAWWTIASDPGPSCLAARAGHRNTKWDVIVCVYATRFVHMDYVDSLLEKNPQAKLGWWSTEYDITRPYGFKDLEFVLLNFEEKFYAGKKRFYRKALVANYNALVAQPRSKATPRLGSIAKARDCIYYGRYRPDRAKYFRRYLNDETIDLSTSKRNVKNYYREGIRGKMLDKMSWSPQRETLRLYRSSLYIEDELTHRVYNHPASRWYEGVNCTAYSVIDRSCARTMKMAGIEVPEELWVDGPGDIRARALPWIAGQDGAWMRRWAEQGMAERARTITQTADFLESL
jgi:hypothetical protein